DPAHGIREIAQRDLVLDPPAVQLGPIGQGGGHPFPNVGHVFVIDRGPGTYGDPILVIGVHRVHGQVPIDVLHIGQGGGSPVGVGHLHRGVPLGVVEVQVTLQYPPIAVQIVLVVVQGGVLRGTVVYGRFRSIVQAVKTKVL